MVRSSCVFVALTLSSGCSVSVGSTPTSEPSNDGAHTTAPTTTEAAAGTGAEPATPTRTNPDAKPKRTSPAAKPTSYAEGIAALDPSEPSAFASAVGLFIEFHPAGTTRASTLRMDLLTFLEFVETTTAAADETVRASEGLMAAACEGAGFDCGAATPADRAQLEALHARGIRFAYGGEGTVQVAVDHAGVASALGVALDDASKTFLAATHASTLLSEGFDEGGFSGSPALAVDALILWETLVADPGPYAADAPQQAAAVRESYLRLCYNGEQQNPGCQVNRALRASYAGFAKAHGSSPSAPVVAAFYQALRRRKWQANADTLDAIVKKALAAGPASPS